MTSSVVVATEASYFLAEGPVWDPHAGRVLWVDIEDGAVLSGELLDDGTIRVDGVRRFDTPVGAVAPAADGSWIVAGRHAPIVVCPGGSSEAMPAIVSGDRRLNDGKPDPRGFFVVGTLALSEGSPSEMLVCVDPANGPQVLDSDISLSNGLAWALDGTVLFHADTARQVVYRRAYDPVTGAVGPREVFVRFDEGFPDGMTIDAESHLWIAVWGRGEIRRYSPGGAHVETLTVPAPHVSSVAFAGDALEILVITSAREDLSAEELVEHPLSGRLFTAKPRVGGIALPLWNGRTPT